MTFEVYIAHGRPHQSWPMNIAMLMLGVDMLYWPSCVPIFQGSLGFDFQHFCWPA